MCARASRPSAGCPSSGLSAVHAWHAEPGGLADAHEELLVYQTLVGALPIERARLDGYLEKALREGKVNTNWLTPRRLPRACGAGIRVARRRAHLG